MGELHGIGQKLLELAAGRGKKPDVEATASHRQPSRCDHEALRLVTNGDGHHVRAVSSAPLLGTDGLAEPEPA